MKKQLHSLSFLLLFLISSYPSLAQIGECVDIPKTRVMLVGDSWANFMWTYKSLTDALDQNGFADVKDNGNLTAIISMQAETWDSDGWIDLLKARVKQMKDADIFVIFIGGNDVIWKWRRDKPASILLPYADEMLSHADDIIREILKIRPEAQFVIGSYDYPNFAETMEDVNNPYRDQWESFGYAPPSMLNDALIYFETYREQYYKNQGNPQIHYINNIGVVQYYGGYPTPSLYEPYATFPPKSVPLPYGDKRYPSHPNYMGNYVGLVKDAFHLNGVGYRFIANNMIRNYISGYLLKEFTPQYSQGDKDGWVSSLGQVSQGNGSRIGKVNAEDYAGIFTFNTKDLLKNIPIENGALFLTKKSGVGELRNTNAAKDEIVVEMKVGHFGESDDIEAADFSDMADFSSAGCVVGHAKINQDAKFRVDLSPDVLAAISQADQVQFRVKVNFAPNSGNLQFFDYYGGNEEDKYFAPTLELKYQGVKTAIKENNIKPLSLYPNPAIDKLHIALPEEYRGVALQAYLTNMLGSVVKKWALSGSDYQSLVDIEGLPAGVYNLNLTDGKSVRNGRVVIQ